MQQSVKSEHLSSKIEGGSATKSSMRLINWIHAVITGDYTRKGCYASHDYYPKNTTDSYLRAPQAHGWIMTDGESWNINGNKLTAQTLLVSLMGLSIWDLHA